MTGGGRPAPDDPPPRRGGADGHGGTAWTAGTAGTGPAERPAVPRPYPAGATIVEEPATRADWRLSAWLAGVVVAVLVIISGTAWVVSDASSADGPRPAGPAPPSSSTVLVVMTDSRDRAVASALIGLREREATCVMVPAQLVVEGPDSAGSSLTELVAASDRTAVTALSRELGVRIDGTWRMSPKTLAALVDFVNGVTVDVDARVTAKGALAEGKEPGKRLSGEAAAKHASTLQRRRSELQLLARFYAVLEGVLLAMPDDPVKRKRALETMREGATTLSRERFLAVVGEMHERAQNEQMEDSLLPLERRSATGPYRVDAAELEKLLDEQLSYARLPQALERQVRVLVQSDGGSAWRARQIRERLAAASLTYVAADAADEEESLGTRGAPATGLPSRTKIIVPSESAADIERGAEVAEALGIPDERIVVRSIDDATADVVLDVGKDLTRLLKKDRR